MIANHDIFYTLSIPGYQIHIVHKFESKTGWAKKHSVPNITTQTKSRHTRDNAVKEPATEEVLLGCGYLMTRHVLPDMDSRFRGCVKSPFFW